MTFRHQVCCAVLFSKSVVKKKIMKYVWVKNEVTIGMLSYFLKIFYLQVFKVIMSVKILS